MAIPGTRKSQKSPAATCRAREPLPGIRSRRARRTGADGVGWDGMQGVFPPWRYKLAAVVASVFQSRQNWTGAAWKGHTGWIAVQDACGGVCGRSCHVRCWAWVLRTTLLGQGEVSDVEVEEDREVRVQVAWREPEVCVVERVASILMMRKPEQSL